MEITNKILNELQLTLSQVSECEVDSLVSLILNSKRVFIKGAGRSGFMASGFAMRLMHLGISAYFFGDVSTPSIQKEDLLFICSGSGETGSLKEMAKKAQSIGCAIGLITINNQSSIAILSDSVVRIPAPSPKASGSDQFVSCQPMGSLFEQSLMLLLDSMVVVLMDKMNLTSDIMFKNHANLE
ncbi:MAG: 6-phospho-3-hexuloisomerase [Erysipelotrichaceae bacterium]